MLRQILKFTLTALIVWVPCFDALVAAPQNQDVPVITSIEDVEAAIAPALQIKSDGLGGYLNNRDIQSLIQGGAGDWVLATNLKSSTRMVYLDFSQPVAGSGPGPNGAPIPLPNGAYHLRVITKCHLYGSYLLGLSSGQTVDCPMTIGFEIGSDGYRIQMNPRTGVYVYPKTSVVNMTCTGTAPDTQCNQWKLEPSDTFVAPDGSLSKRNRANLTKIVTSKGKSTEFNQGDFYFSFSIRLAKQ